MKTTTVGLGRAPVWPFALLLRSLLQQQLSPQQSRQPPSALPSLAVLAAASSTASTVWAELQLKLVVFLTLLKTADDILKTAIMRSEKGELRSTKTCIDCWRLGYMRNIKHRSVGLNGKRQQKGKTGTIVDQPSPTGLACGHKNESGSSLGEEH